MSTIHPRQLFVATVAGWVNRHQHDIIDYLVDENRVLKVAWLILTLGSLLQGWGLLPVFSIRRRAEDDS